jgi:hypothetical protein
VSALRGVVPAAFLAAVACATPAPAVTAPAANGPADCPGPAWTCFRAGPCPFTEFKGSVCAVGVVEQIAGGEPAAEAATSRARREMADLVQSKVDGLARLVRDAERPDALGAGPPHRDVTALSRSVVDRTLQHVTVPKTWFSTQTRTCFAIAVLDSDALVAALKALEDAKGLADSTRLEIDRRAERVVTEWQADGRDGEPRAAAGAGSGPR